MAVTPCLWVIDTGCCSTWATYAPEVQARATEYATYVLWAATGRQFGLCTTTVQPTNNFRGTISMPIYDTNLSEVLVSCGPRDCRVYLPGHVDSITQVTIGGVVVAPADYEVHDYSWLVRTDGTCWPTADFEVTYVYGTPAPATLLDAAGTLACEYAKACVGTTCRLPGRAAQIARQGVSVNMVSLERLLEAGFTGLAEVDQVIQAINPGHLPYPLRVFTPDIPRPRTVTYP